MHEHKKLFVRPMVEDDVDRLLEIRIRRISAYDIERNRKDIAEVEASIKENQRKLRRLTDTTVAYLEGLLEKYGAHYPRRTKVVSFEAVSKREVALSNLRLSYDPEAGLLRHQRARHQVPAPGERVRQDPGGRRRRDLPHHRTAGEALRRQERAT